ncbi:nicotinamide mononucleotide transporter PnuC [Moraxella macacae 0408225]|uniref:Nicotinamide riboside transporter PnuC n=1 Tax=Moraxella macacae 0408225 TaxID=1230338 RepID=L2F6G6_9GAMM|nr:nicotinamide riboside transporter PnuC [Moraxella macacae]ELA08505.1 nicotinamide mononucleotide transporter PnuC [Moraxella macacae 0408225]
MSDFFNHLFAQLFAQYQAYTPMLMALELIASVFGLISVLLSKRGNVLVFPVGLISTGLYVYLLWQWQLFGDMLINVYYSAMAIFGWINWQQNQQNQQIVTISTTTLKEWQQLGLIAIGSFIFVGVVYYFKPFINNHFSMTGVSLGFSHFVWTDYVDILTTGLFLVGMLLMANRKIENWLVWIAADAISVPLYFYKGIIFTSVQYFLFTLVAILGYLSWQKLLVQQHLTQHQNLQTTL